jgi:hypothetical protein
MYPFDVYSKNWCISASIFMKGRHIGYSIPCEKEVVTEARFARRPTGGRLYTSYTEK